MIWRVAATPGREAEEVAVYKPAVSRPTLRALK